MSCGRRQSSFHVAHECHDEIEGLEHLPRVRQYLAVGDECPRCGVVCVQGKWSTPTMKRTRKTYEVEARLGAIGFTRRYAKWNAEREAKRAGRRRRREAVER